MVSPLVHARALASDGHLLVQQLRDSWWGCAEAWWLTAPQSLRVLCQHRCAVPRQNESSLGPKLKVINDESLVTCSLVSEYSALGSFLEWLMMTGQGGRVRSVAEFHFVGPFLLGGKHCACPPRGGSLGYRPLGTALDTQGEPAKLALERTFEDAWGSCKRGSLMESRTL